MHLRVISFGKKSGGPYEQEIRRYCRMASSWARLEFVYLRPVSAKTPEAALKKEGQHLEKTCEASSFCIVLGEEGEAMDSYQFSSCIHRVSGQIDFVIGSAYGVSGAFKKKADKVLRISSFTMPYALCRLVLAEQLYRALSIARNHPYSK
ncbi:MAG: 23S rRNA (pseudouridine(1915)-N(3))-methyltransferase RlmH [Fibrobacterota bacterium]